MAPNDRGVRIRFGLRELLMATALVAILMLLPSVGGCGEQGQVVCDLSFSPDGKSLAVGMYNWRDAQVPLKGYKADVCRTIEIIQIDDPSDRLLVEQEMRLGNQGPCFLPHTMLQFQWQSACLAVLDWDGHDVRLFDINDQIFTRSVPVDVRSAWPFDAQFSYDGSRIVGGGIRVQVFELSSGKAILTRPLQSPVPQMSLSTRGDRLLEVANGVELWDVDQNVRLGDFEPPKAFHNHQDCVGARLSPNSKMACVATDSAVWTSSIDEGTRPQVLIDDTRDSLHCTDIEFSTDSRSLALATFDCVRVFRLNDGNWTSSVISNKPASAVVFSPDGTLLACGGYDSRIEVRDVRSGDLVKAFKIVGKSRLAWPWMILLLVAWGTVYRLWCRWTSSNESSAIT